MSQQAFFEEVNVPQTTTKAKKRVFIYNGQRFEDPGPEYTNAEILNFLSSTYPELASGSWTSRTLPDGASGEVEEVTFVKVTGDKG